MRQSEETAWYKSSDSPCALGFRVNIKY